MYEQILDQLEQLLKQEIRNFGGDFGQDEQAVMQMMLSLGQGLLQRVVNRQPNGRQGNSIACKCGGSLRFLQDRSRQIHTLMGWIKLKRAYYRCPDCGSSLAPYDKLSGLGRQQLSPALAKACCMLAVDDSFEEVSQKIEQLFGQRVCDDTVKQAVHQVGKVVLQQQDQELRRFFEDKQIPQAQTSVDRLYVSADGTTVSEKEGWHEAKLACIYWENERFEVGKRYVGRFDNSDIFGWHMWMEACKCGLREAKEVVYLGDGASWIRSEHYRHFNRATFIIDWYHAAEHLWDCGKALFGEGTEATDRWVSERLVLLGEGQTKRLLDDLTRLRKAYRGHKRKSIDTLYRYISVNEEQMRYDVFRSKGYDIGSGAAEGGCKHVIGKRLKQSGMIWSRAGSSATLALRTTWLNGSWDELWSQKPLAA